MHEPLSVTRCYICIHIYIYTYMHACVCVCVNICIHLHIYIHIYMCLLMFTYVILSLIACFVLTGNQRATSVRKGTCLARFRGRRSIYFLWCSCHVFGFHSLWPGLRFSTYFPYNGFFKQTSHGLQTAEPLQPPLGQSPLDPQALIDRICTATIWDLKST